MKTVKTELLEIAYFDDGPQHEWPILLLHGWPDDAYGMHDLASFLNGRFRAIVPFLRGCGPTRFLSHKTFRDGRGVALAQDVVDLLDALKIEKCVVVGHDWGARAAYNLAAFAPERVDAMITLGLQYTPNGKFEIPSFDQARLWWYQWFMTTDAGVKKIREDPIGFARMQWESWSPAGWFRESDFSQTAESFKNPDWLAITLHAYRSRWKEEPVDPRYWAQQDKIEHTAKLSVPFRTIVGKNDGVDIVHEDEDHQKYFSQHHELTVLQNVGHFPAREASADVGNLIHGILDTLEYNQKHKNNFL